MSVEISVALSQTVARSRIPGQRRDSMKPVVLLMVIAVSLAQERPILAQERRGLPSDSFDEAVTAGQRFAAVAPTDASGMRFSVMASPPPAHRAPIRRAS